MWLKLEPKIDPKVTDEAINFKYAKRELRIVTESNREQLPNFVDALKRPNWLVLRPFYQRRLRWDPIRQSKLIESFIMNMPVPPLFVYESDLAKYEVMDGQQRITAIKDFYSNRLELRGLEQWPELNGRVYETLPTEIRKGLDRRSISYIVLLKESAPTSEEEALLRQEVFERLNTGGIKLSHQEIRNSLFHGKFNDLLLYLAKNPVFRKAWGIPPYTESEETNPPEELLKNATYTTMKDVENALRFFALRHVDHYRKGMKGFLDFYMVRARAFSSDDIEVLRHLFESTIQLGDQVFGPLLFRPWDPIRGEWSERAQVAFADAVMVSLSRHLEAERILIARKDLAIEKTRELLATHPVNTFSGQRNTKKDVQERINLFDQMIERVIAQ